MNLFRMFDVLWPLNKAFGASYGEAEGPIRFTVSLNSTPTCLQIPRAVMVPEMKRFPDGHAHESKIGSPKVSTSLH
jgi:hypothetical protein